MKKIILIVLATIFCSCGTDQGEARTYESKIINNSGNVIEIIPYENGIKFLDKIVILQNGQTLTKKDVDYPPYNGRFQMITVLDNKIFTDKIDIIFNGTKKITYEDCSPTNNCNAQPRNIFNSEFSEQQTEVYTITLEDFQNATDCGGNCN